MSNAYPYSIKNWKDPNQYLKPNVSYGHREANKFDLNYWRWEFLRRNADYQRLYDSFEKYSDDRSIEIEGKLSDFGLFLYIDPKDDLGYMSLPSLCSIHHLTDFKKHSGNQIYDNKLNDTKALHSILMQHTEVQQKGGIFVSLDLNLPLDIQFQKLKKLIEGHYKLDKNKTIGHVRPREWKVYLRLLDAFAENIEIQDIINIIYPSQEDDYDKGKPITKKIMAAYAKAIQHTKNFAIGGEFTVNNSLLGY